MCLELRPIRRSIAHSPFRCFCLCYPHLVSYRFRHHVIHRPKSKSNVSVLRTNYFILTMNFNVWIMNNKYVVPVRKPTCSGEGYQDNAFAFTIPTDFNNLGSKVPGFAGCTKLGDCQSRLVWLLRLWRKLWIPPLHFCQFLESKSYILASSIPKNVMQDVL